MQMLLRFDALLQEKRARPATDDLMSRIIHSEALGNMPPAERMGNIALLIVGGNDITRNSMSGLIDALHRFPGELDRLHDDPSLIGGAVSEIVRWQSPVTHMRRTATEDTELAGQRIAKGEKIVRRCRPLRCRPGECAPASGLRTRYSPLHRHAARRIAAYRLYRGIAAPELAGRIRRKPAACAVLFPAWVHFHAGSHGAARLDTRRIGRLGLRGRLHPQHPDEYLPLRTGKTQPLYFRIIGAAQLARDIPQQEAQFDLVGTGRGRLRCACTGLISYVSSMQRGGHQRHVPRQRRQMTNGLHFVCNNTNQM